MRNRVSVCGSLRVGVLAAVVGAAAGLAWAGGEGEPVLKNPTQAEATPPRADDPLDVQHDNLKLRGAGGGIACAADLFGGDCTGPDVALGANFSFEGATNFQVTDNFVPTSGTITTICWAGRYAMDMPPAVESFRITIYNDTGTGLPDIANPPVFERIFTNGGTPGVDELAGPVPLVVPGDPAADEFAYSITVDAGITVVPNQCYWLEVVNQTSVAGGTNNWGWVGSTGGQDLRSYQAIGGNYTAFSSVANDRAYCIDAGLDNFGGLCPLKPIPEICTNDPENGQQYDGVTGFGFAAASPGSTNRTIAPTFTAFQRAENAQLASGGSITGVCFWSFWFRAGGGQIAGPTAPTVQVIYYENNGGVPGAEIASFETNDGVTTIVGDGTEYNVSHAPVTVDAGECFFLSIGSRVVGNDNESIRMIWFLTNDGGGIAGPPPAPYDRLIAVRTAQNPPGAWANVMTNPPDISNLTFLFNVGPVETPDCAEPPPPPPANDLCANATPISGTGEFNYDNRGALTDGPADCDIGGSASIQRDVWFRWTAPCDGDFTFSTCFFTETDDKIAVYDGACPPAGAQLGCDDDGCGVVGGGSIVTFTATGGNQYLLRVGVFAGASGAESTFEITRDAGECPPDDCLADFDNSGNVDSNDFFAFLTAFFNGDPSADVDGTPGINSNDFFFFLTAFFEGCP